MFSAFCDAAWRVVILLWLAVAPYGAPVDAAPSASTTTAAVRLFGFAVLALGLVLVVRRSASRWKPLAAATAATMVAAAVASVVFDGDRGPLARGVWFVVPFAWAALAALASGPLSWLMARSSSPGATGLPSRPTRIVAALLVLAAGAASFYVCGKRFTTDELWKQALAANPANESAALAVAGQLERAGASAVDRRAAYDLLVACAKARGDGHTESCRCDEAANADAIDLALYREARASLETANTCPRTPRRVGLLAEALVGTTSTDEGLHQAEIALASDPNEAHAAYARAWGTMLKGYLPDARKFAEQAVALERGVVANLLLGLVDFQLGDIDAAAPQFQAALTSDPTSVQASYDTSLIAQRKNQYHDAREGYLRTLRLDPTYADAHYNLIVLTFNAGAGGEAQHHLDDFATKCPLDPRLSALRAMLAPAQPNAPGVALTPPPPPSVAPAPRQPVPRR